MATSPETSPRADDFAADHSIRLGVWTGLIHLRDRLHLEQGDGNGCRGSFRVVGADKPLACHHVGCVSEFNEALAKISQKLAAEGPPHWLNPVAFARAAAQYYGYDQIRKLRVAAGAVARPRLTSTLEELLNPTQAHLLLELQDAVGRPGAADPAEVLLRAAAAAAGIGDADADDPAVRAMLRAAVEDLRDTLTGAGLTDVWADTVLAPLRSRGRTPIDTLPGDDGPSGLDPASTDDPSAQPLAAHEAWHAARAAGASLAAAGEAALAVLGVDPSWDSPAQRKAMYKRIAREVEAELPAEQWAAQQTQRLAAPGRPVTGGNQPSNGPRRAA